MSPGKRRCGLAGLVLAAGMAFAAPGTATAADLGKAFSVADLWLEAAHWWAGLWQPAPGGSALPPPKSPAGQEGSGTAVAPVCRGDEGSCIDPNG